MANPINNTLQTNQSVYKNFIDAVDNRLESQIDLKVAKREDRIRSIASIILSVILSASAGSGGYSLSSFIRKGAEKATVDIVVGTATFIISGITCYNVVYKPFSSIEFLRNQMRGDAVVQKMSFSRDFSRETDNELQRITRTCPLSCKWPRFPVVNRANVGSMQTAEIYDWVALQFILTVQPLGHRSNPILKWVNIDDFVLCIDLLHEMHGMLAHRGEISSPNPFSALLTELGDMNDLPLQTINELNHNFRNLIND